MLQLTLFGRIGSASESLGIFRSIESDDRMFTAAVLSAQTQNGRLVATETGVNRNRTDVES